MDVDRSADLALLETTPDDATRNRLALQLADARVPGTADVLLRLIAREDLASRRGTLVHSLGQFDCTPYVPTLVHLVATGNWEVAHEAAQILDGVDEVRGAEVAAAYAEACSAASAASEDWRRELLTELIDAFQ